MKSVPLVQKANATPNAIFAPVPVDLESGPVTIADIAGLQDALDAITARLDALEA